jgi:hypothetical protein
MADMPGLDERSPLVEASIARAGSRGPSPASRTHEGGVAKCTVVAALRYTHTDSSEHADTPGVA